MSNITKRLAEALRHLLKALDSEPCRLDHDGNCQTHFLDREPCRVKGAKETLAAYDAQPSGWISVEERLPEEYTYCLVAAETQHVFPSLFRDGAFRMYGEKNQRFTSPLTHWRELPEPPKGGAL